MLVAGLAAMAGCTALPTPTSGIPPTPTSGIPPVPTGAATTPAATGTPSSPLVPQGSPTATTGPTGPTGPAAVTGRVMTFNILTGRRTAADYRSAVPDRSVDLAKRLPALAGWIQFADPGLVAIQENEAMVGGGRPLDQLAPLLPAYTPVLAQQNLPFLVKEDDWRIGQPGHRLISTTYYHRYLTWCHLTQRSTGRQLLLANTHLDPTQIRSRALARRRQARIILDRLQVLNPGWRIPMLLVGDFNLRTDERRELFRAPMDLLADAGLQEVAGLAPERSKVPHAASWSGFGARVGNRWRYQAIRTNGMRYDQLWADPLVRVHGWEVVTGPGVRMIGGHPYFADAPLPSDHLPVMAEITLRRS